MAFVSELEGSMAVVGVVGKTVLGSHLVGR